MPLVVQDALVTLAAVIAASIVVRRVFTTVRPDPATPSKCASCPAAQHKQRVELPAANLGMPKA
jgi:hypothetical protein